MDIVKNLSGPWSSVAGLLTQGSIHDVEKIWTSAGMEEPQKARLVVSPLFMRKTDLEALHEGLVKLHDISQQDKSEWVQMLSIAVDGYDGRIHTDKVMEEMPAVRSSIERVEELTSNIDTMLFRPLEEKYLTDTVLTSLGLDSVVAKRNAYKQECTKTHSHFKIREKSVADVHQQHIEQKVQRPSMQGTDGFGVRKRPLDMSQMTSLGKKSRPGTSCLFLKPSKPKTLGKVPPKKKAAVLDISALETARKANEERRQNLLLQKEKEKELEAKARAEAHEAEKKAKEERKQILKDVAKRKKEEEKQKALEERQKAQEEKKKAIEDKKIKRAEERMNREREKQLKEAISSMDVTLALQRARMKSDVESTKEIGNPSAFDKN